MRQAYHAFPVIVQQWESWIEKAPRNPSDCPMYLPFANELFGVDNNFKNGENWYFNGEHYVNAASSVSSSNKNNVPEVNAFGFGIDDMVLYETAPSMTFGDDINTCSVPYKQIDANGKQFFTSENDLNIQNIQRKRKRTNKECNKSDSYVDSDGYMHLTTLKRHKIPNFGDPVGYIGKQFKALSEKAKKLLEIGDQKYQVLGVVKDVKAADSSTALLFKFCDAEESENPTKDSIKYYSCKALMSTDRSKNGNNIIYIIFS